MPLPMKSTPKRFGIVAAPAAASATAPADSGVAPQTGMDSSHGSAIVTPTPRKKVRRDIWKPRDFCRDDSLILPVLLCEHIMASLVEELRTGHDILDQRVKPVAVRGELRMQVGNGCLIRKNQSAPQRVDEHLAAEIVHEILLAMRPDVIAQSRHSRFLRAIRECRPAIHRPAGQIVRSRLSNRAIAFEHQPERIKPQMAHGAARVFTMPRQ